MADDVVKKLLLSFKISAQDLKADIDNIKRQLNAVNEQAKKDAVQMTATQKEQLNLTKQQIADQKLLSSQAKAMADFDRAKVAWEKQQQEALKIKIQQRILETTEIKKQTVEQQASLRLEQEQLKITQQRYRLLLQQQNMVARQARATGGGAAGGGGGGFTTALAGMLGGGPVGMIAAGASIGNVFSEQLTRLIDKMVASVHNLGEALIEATGPAAQLREQFEKLTKRAGLDADEYLTKLRTATRGLADDVTIYRVANNFMQQGMKVTEGQITRLIGATVNLARAQGRDATVAMNALERASKTGRTQILAMVTGLTRAEMQIRGVSAAMDPVTRNTLQFNQVLQAMEARLRAVGTPATTLPELLKQWQNVQKNFNDDLAIAISKSEGYKTAIASLSKLLFDLEPILAKVVKGLATLTDSFITLTPAVKMVAAVGRALYEIDAAIVKVTLSLTPFSAGFETIFSAGKAGKFRQVMAQMALGFLTLAEYVNEAAIRIHAFGEVAEAVLQKRFADAVIAYRSMKKDLDEARTEYGQSAIDIAKFGLGIDKETPAAGKQTNTAPNIALAKQMQRLQLEIDKEIYFQEHAAKLKQIQADSDAEIASLRLTGRETGEPKQETQKRVDLAVLKEAAAEAKENTAFNQRMAALEDAQIQDTQNAYRKHVAELTKLAEEGVQARISLLEKEFQSGRKDADDYLIEKRDLINQEYLATKEGLDKQLIAAKDNATERASIEGQIAQAKSKAEKELAILDTSEDDIRLKALTNRFNLEKKILDLQSTTQKVQRGFGAGGGEIAIQQEIINLNQQHINQLEQLRAGAELYSEKWIQISEQIQQAGLAIVQAQQKQAQLKNISGPIGGLAGAAAGVAGVIPGQERIAQFLSRLQQASEALQRFGTAVNQAGGGGNFFRNIGQSFLGLFGRGTGFKKPETEQMKLVSSLDKLKDSVDKNTSALTGKGSKEGQTGQPSQQGEGGGFMDNLQNLVGGVQNMANGIQGLIQGITGGTSGAGGALSGGMAGMQFGAQVGGPIGAAIGLVGGGIMGGIFGNKEKQLQMEIHKIQVQLNSIMEDLRSGTISLNQALQDLRRERQAAIQTLAQNPKSGKGGGKGGKKGFSPTQAQEAIAAIDNQIQALVDQQTQILQNLHSSLMELSQPIAFQEYISSLDQIIQKYEQFASAAQGNAQEVALANQYLNDSLQQYVTTLSQQLNQAQQQAIQDALTLINLEYQRQQIINQEAQQEYDIMSQGVLTRQRTTAMTKGQEIGYLRYQRDMQLEQINEQIALNQAKVTAEQKIFGLATTRIGLETQLLAAQEEQANYQIAQVQALAQVVGALQSGLTGGQIMQQIEGLMAGGTLPTGPGILFTLLQELGLAGNVPPGVTQGPYGITNWLAQIPSQYASAAQYVASLDPNFQNMILAGQYQQAAADAQQYASQGTAEGFDMSGLISWLGGSTTNPYAGIIGTLFPNLNKPQGRDVGGPVDQSGIYSLKRGEWVLPSPLVNLLDALSPKQQTSASTGANIVGGAVVNDQQITVESQLNDSASYRYGLEMQIVSAKTAILNAESQHLQALSDFLNQLNNSSAVSGTSDLEALLQKKYETRGRMGLGNFRREYL